MKSLARIIATELYLHTVREYFDWPTLGKLQKLLEEKDTGRDNNYWRSCSRRFYKNMRGTCIKDQVLIRKIERIIPGTQKILTTPLWDILENPEATEEELHQYMHKLPASITGRLFKQDDEDPIPIRKKLTRKSQLHAVTMIGSLDSLASCLMIIREMDLQDRLDPYIEAKWCAYWSLLLLVLNKPFFAVSNELSELIYEHFIEKNTPLPTRLKKGFIEIKPEAFHTPKKHYTLLGVREAESGLLWHAQTRGLIGNTVSDQNRFLFYTMKDYSIPTVEKIVKRLPFSYRYKGNYRELDYPLKEIMWSYRADQRKALAASVNFMD